MVQVKLVGTEDFKLLQNYGISVSESAELLLLKTENGWRLQDSEKRRLEINFDENKSDYHRRHKGSGELIARALGVKSGIKNTVDLTAGLGIDAVFLSQLGFQVTSIERNPLLVFLLHEAQKKTERVEVKNIQWILSDALEYLKNFRAPPDSSCYFDPMYPDKKKSALPRQEMVLFRNIVGKDEDSLEVLQLALSSGFKRIVVKRPIKAPVILDKPDFQLESKLVRYDVYYGREKV